MPRELDGAYALLGLSPGAGADEVAAAYRRRAKALHPDRTGADDAAQMAAVNAAHDVLTAALLHGLGGGEDPAGPPSDPRTPGFGVTPPPPAPSAAARARRLGHWLPAATRRALGPELLRELEDGEMVDVVTLTSTWASGRTVLAVTDRRVLWLLDDAVSGRVRSLSYVNLLNVSQAVRGRRRRTGSVRLAPRQGRGVTFTELAPELAQAIARRVDAGRRASDPRGR